jgi:hypothetical protein
MYEKQHDIIFGHEGRKKKMTKPSLDHKHSLWWITRAFQKNQKNKEKKKTERERDKTSLRVICALFTCQVTFNT